MAELSDGTVTSRLKPIVTVLTEALLRDFACVYYPAKGYKNCWYRERGHGDPEVVTDEALRADVREWLMNLQDDYGGHESAERIVGMIRRNEGWVNLLANRVIKVLRAEE